MALFAVDVEKSLDPEFWTNRYVVQADNINLASLTAASIVNAEKAVHLDVVSFTKYRVRDMDPDTDNFIIVPINDVGEIGSTDANWLPLFNVVRVDFGAEAGRPSRKYLRPPIPRSWCENGLLLPSVVTQFQTDYANVINSISAYVDVDGQAIVGATVFRPIAMRQLRRGSRRRTTPILP